MNPQPIPFLKHLFKHSKLHLRIAPAPHGQKNTDVILRKAMKRSKTTFQILFLVGLTFALISSMALATTHSHLADQGRTSDLSCPICNFLMGFTLCIVSIALLIVTLERYGCFLQTNQRLLSSEPVLSLEPRAPPVL